MKRHAFVRKYEYDVSELVDSNAAPCPQARGRRDKRGMNAPGFHEQRPRLRRQRNGSQRFVGRRRSDMRAGGIDPKNTVGFQIKIAFAIRGRQRDEFFSLLNVQSHGASGRIKNAGIRGHDPFSVLVRDKRFDLGQRVRIIRRLSQKLQLDPFEVQLEGQPICGSVTNPARGGRRCRGRGRSGGIDGRGWCAITTGQNGEEDPECRQWPRARCELEAFIAALLDGVANPRTCEDRTFHIDLESAASGFIDGIVEQVGVKRSTFCVAGKTFERRATNLVGDICSRK